LDYKQEQKLLLVLQIQEPFKCVQDQYSLDTLARYLMIRQYQFHLLNQRTFLNLMTNKYLTLYQPKKGKWVKGRMRQSVGLSAPQ
jgi:hypothetical protein